MAILRQADARSITAPNWSAVVAMSLSVFVLIASEFLPVSLLTPIAHDLGLAGGQAGQAISISGMFAVLTSLFIPVVVGNFDRKFVLIILIALVMLSGTVVAAAPSFAVLMVGRALLGIVIGGFWSISTATIMRLVPADAVPRALAITNAGNALAGTLAAPIGSYLGSLIGWRGAFFCVVPLAIAASGWLAVTLPRLPGTSATHVAATFKLLGRPVAASGMTAIFLLFAGQFALFTYLRPFLESVTHVNVSTLSLLLLVVGTAGLFGTAFIGQVLTRSLRAVLVFSPAFMALIAVALWMFGTQVAAVAVLLAAWGLASAGPVGWGVWLSRALPDDAEIGGGLMVATIQLAITAGAVIGGHLFDAFGYQATFVLSAIVLFAAAAVTHLAFSTLKRRDPS